MQCFGNCVLVKDIKSLQKNQSKDNNLQVKVKEFQLFAPSTFDLQYIIPLAFKNHVTPYVTTITSNFFLSIFLFLSVSSDFTTGGDCLLKCRVLSTELLQVRKTS